MILRLQLALICLLVLGGMAGRAEQLPVRVYSTADGLPRDDLYGLKLDSRGFLWVFTYDGITRFDGFSFINYTTADGLPDRRVNDLLEAGDGTYWLATASGLCRFNPRGSASLERVRENISARNVEGSAASAPMFTTFNPDDQQQATVFNALLADEAGGIWCGTERGLYRMTEREGRVRFDFIDMKRLTGKPAQPISAIIKDRRASLWMATEGNGLFRLLPDGRAEHYWTEHGLPNNSLASLLEDREGNLWVGTRDAGGLFKLVAEPAPGKPVVDRLYTLKDGLPSEWIISLFQARDGKLWVGTVKGLCQFVPSGGGASQPSFRVYPAASGLCDHDVRGLTEDRDGNLWAATRCGLMKVARNDFVAYSEADGLSNHFINSIFEDQTGDLIVINNKGVGGRIINRFDGKRFTPVKPHLPTSIKYHGWGWNQIVIRDHLGEWWVPTGDDALFRFPKVERLEELASISPKAVYTNRDGLIGKEVFRLYEDARGDIWLALTAGGAGLMRWDRASEKFQDLTTEAGLPTGVEVTAFAEDRSGNLWIGTGDGGILRYRDGRFRRFTTEDGVPRGWILYLYLDQKGRLWIASQLDGLNCIDDPSAESPRFTRYTTNDGLSSNNIRSITEDRWGRIYVGTGHGVDRLNPETGTVKQYTVADGVPKGTIEMAYRDRLGALWFGSFFGLARLVPEAEENEIPPSIYIEGLRIEGVAQRLSELGEALVPPLELEASRNQVSIDFVGLSADLGEQLRYQYRLVNGDSSWSEPTAQRTVNYANLSPGAYRFEVRALSPSGRTSPAPAVFSFTILRPIWQRWWFLSLAVLALFLVVYRLYRFRVSRLLEVANMRTRIATDLHDDIGANLTKIAILSEVARQQLGTVSPQASDPLTSIADISRDSVAAMSDIVWAINAERDSLLDLVRRMRQHAEEIFLSRDIKLTFDAPGPAQNLRMGMGLRRDLFLIFKEAVNNAARHSRCTHVFIDLHSEGAQFSLEISDDGVGFDTSTDSDGNGLLSMRRRAQSLGGTLEVLSSRDNGTTVRLKIPYAGSGNLF